MNDAEDQYAGMSDAERRLALRERLNALRLEQRPSIGPTPKPQTATDAGFQAVIKDIGMGAVETPRQVVGGAADIVRGAISLVPGKLADDLERIATVEPATSNTGKVVRALSAFLVPYAGASKAIQGAKGVGAAMEILNSPAVRPVVAGAVADLMNPDAEGGALSSVVQSIPELANPVTEYLAGADDDSALEKRFKATLEGAGLGVAADAVFRGFRAMRGIRRAKVQAQKLAVEQARTEAERVSAEVRGRNVVELKIGKDDLGEPAGDVADRIRARLNQAKRRVAEVARGAQPEGEVFLNKDRIQSSANAKALQQDTADLNKAAIDEARRGEKVTFQEISRLADMLGVDAVALRNTILARKKGDLFNAEEMLAARRLLTDMSEEIIDLANRAAQTQAVVDKYKVLMAARELYAVQAQVIGSRTETGRALAAMRQTAISDAERGRRVLQELERLGGDAEIDGWIKLIRELDDPIKVNKLVRDLEGDTLGKSIVNYRARNLLWSIKTHVVNTTSNLAFAISSVIERWAASPFSDGEILTREGTEMAVAMMKSARAAFRLAAHNLRTGEIPDFISARSILDIHNDLEATLRNERDFGFARALDYLHKTSLADKARGAASGAVAAHGLSARLLHAEDVMFKTINYWGQLNALAHRSAARAGLQGREYAEEVARILDNPPASLRADAREWADYQTFTNELGNIGSDVAKFANREFGRGQLRAPWFRMVLPFVRTPINLFSRGIERSPLAPVMSQFWDDLAAGGSRRGLALARFGMGTTFMLAMSDAYLHGEVTGAGPQEPGEKASWLAAGNKPYSVVFHHDDGSRTFVPYNRFDPFGMMVGTAADVIEGATYAGEWDTEEESNPYALMMAALLRNFASRTYLQSASQFFGALDGKEMWKWDAISRDMATSMLPLMPLAGSVEQVVDPIVRDTREIEWLQGVVAGWRSKIPGLSDSLPPRYDILGEPITYKSELGWLDIAAPVSVMRTTGDPVRDLLGNNRIRVAYPKREIDGVRLTPAEYAFVVKTRGQLARGQLERVMRLPVFQRLTDGPDGGKAASVEEIFRDSGDAARELAIREFPRLDYDIMARKVRGAELKTGRDLSGLLTRGATR